PQAEHVHERVAGVARLEGNLAADGSHSDAVPVAGDAGHDALHVLAHVRAVERSEPQRVHQSNGARAHGEDVADDPADAGRRALVWLDERWMVVRLDFEDSSKAVANIDGAGVLAWSLEHTRPGGWKRSQVHPRTLVAAVFGPHHRENAQFGQGRFAVQELDDL